MSTPPDKPNSRRRFLRTSVALVPIASVAGCDLHSSSPSATTAGNASAASAGAERAPYKPTFFDAKEWAFVQAAVDRLGEFSFILAGLGRALGLLSAEGQSLILAVALISIAMNTLLFAMIDPALAWIRKHSAFARKLEARDDPLAALPMSTPQTHLTGQVVIVGYGKVGTRIAHALDERGIAYVVVEQNRELVEKLRADGIAAVSGDAIEPIVLVQAHIARAGMLVVTLPDVFDVRQIVEISRTLNPTLEVVLCTNSGDEAALLSSEGIGTVFMGETELARGMTEHVLGRMAKPVAAAH